MLYRKISWNIAFPAAIPPVDYAAMYSPALVLLTVAATAYSRSAYKFAAGVEAYLSKPIIKNFDCAGKAYGYYADQDHGCEVNKLHIYIVVFSWTWK